MIFGIVLCFFFSAHTLSFKSEVDCYLLLSRISSQQGHEVMNCLE